MAEFRAVVETLDSLWFFSSILSSPIPTTNPILSLESEESSKEEQSNPVAITQSPDDDSNCNTTPPSSPPPEQEIESPLPAVTVTPTVEKQSNIDQGGGCRGGGEIIVFESKPESPLERRKRMARRSRSKRKIILLELDLCFDDLINLQSPKRSYGGGGGSSSSSFGRSYGILVSQRGEDLDGIGGEIPSLKLNDSLGMERQLKPWDHAVASCSCTVK